MLLAVLFNKRQNRRKGREHLPVERLKHASVPQVGQLFVSHVEHSGEKGALPSIVPAIDGRRGRWSRVMLV